MQTIIGVLSVWTRNKIPVRAIPVFSQSELGTALKRDNVLARSPNVVTRQRNDADEHLTGGVGIEVWRRDHAPACAIPVDRHRSEAPIISDSPDIIRCDHRDAKEIIVVYTAIRAWHHIPAGAIPVDCERAVFAGSAGSRPANRPDIIGCNGIDAKKDVMIDSRAGNNAPDRTVPV